MLTNPRYVLYFCPSRFNELGNSLYLLSSQHQTQCQTAARLQNTRQDLSQLTRSPTSARLYLRARPRGQRSSLQDWPRLQQCHELAGMFKLEECQQDRD